MFARYEEEYKGLLPNGLLHAYGWKQEQLFSWLYEQGICNSFSTMRDWIYKRRNPRPATLMAIYKAYEIFAQDNPPIYPEDIARNLVDVEW